MTTADDADRRPVPNLLRPTIYADDPEVAAALRMYRKVQGCTAMGEADGMAVANFNRTFASAADLLAWLKEGEA